jgi:hypothetical protein
MQLAPLSARFARSYGEIVFAELACLAEAHASTLARVGEVWLGGRDSKPGPYRSRVFWISAKVLQIRRRIAYMRFAKAFASSDGMDSSWLLRGMIAALWDRNHKPRGDRHGCYDDRR